jgi:hypothetical protein
VIGTGTVVTDNLGTSLSDEEATIVLEHWYDSLGVRETELKVFWGEDIGDPCCLLNCRNNDDTSIL